LPYKFIDLQKNVILNQIHNNPDYLVYKSKDDFKDKLRQLAERQLKEAILIDTIAYNESISVDHIDIISYLNLNKKMRTKDFIHFQIPNVKINGKNMPIPYSLIRLNCLREKTLNYIINYLS
jgi:FKBP-type peptidyl-prolyl cis-trans isomerase (trigger factor)